MGILRIIAGVIIVSVVLGVVGLIGWDIFIGQREAHAQYCTDWIHRINQSKADVGLLTGDATIAQLNAEINQYNHECVSGS